MRRMQGLSAGTVQARTVRGNGKGRLGSAELPRVRCVNPDRYAYLFVAVFVPVRDL